MTEGCQVDITLAMPRSNLIAYFVNKHLFLQSELDMLEEPEDDIEDRLALLVIGRLTEHECAQRERSRERRRQEQEDCESLRQLWQARPESSLTEAVIIVSRPVCADCRRFVMEVNRRFRLALLLRHHCLNTSCDECSSRV